MEILRRMTALVEAEEREQDQAIHGCFADRVKHAVVRELKREWPDCDADHLLRGTMVLQRSSGVIEINVPANLDEIMRRR
jgi:hypothetical protein